MFLCSSPSYLESAGFVTLIPVFSSSGLIDLGAIVNDPSVTTNFTSVKLPLVLLNCVLVKFIGYVATSVPSAFAAPVNLIFDALYSGLEISFTS